MVPTYTPEGPQIYIFYPPLYVWSAKKKWSMASEFIFEDP